MRHVTAIVYALVLLTPSGLLLGVAPPSSAQTAVGPICLEVTVGTQETSAFTLFALPMGGDALNGFQFVLSARSIDTPFSGTALVDGSTGEFFLTTVGVGTIATLRGRVNLQTGEGLGSCSVIGAPPPVMPAVNGETNPCDPVGPAAYKLVTCPGNEPA